MTTPDSDADPMPCKPERFNRLSLISMDEAVDSVQKIAGDGLVLFLGAGISVASPSSCPAWNALLDLVVLSANKAHPCLGRYCDLVGPQLSSLKPELLCQVLYNNLLGDFFAFLDILYMGEPNSNHHKVAHMTREYDIPVILTTNLDVHIENAVSQTGSKLSLHVCSSPRRLRKALKTKSNLRSETAVVKLHGSLDDRASIVLTLRQTGFKLEEDLADLIRNVLSSYSVLVVGYSGNDDDIFPVFLNSALETKKVFWILWDNEKSITHNIRAFAGACPNCTLVAADNVSIFERLANNRESTTPEARIADLRPRQSEFLQQWAAGTNEHSWKNFFSELLLLMDCGENVAKTISDESEAIIRTAKDSWAVTKALKNRALALIVLKDYRGALAAISKAAENYMLWGHHREVIECLTVMTTRIPIETKWRGDDPLFWSAQLSGKTYEPYGLGLYNYAAGIHFLNEKRLDLAQNHLLVAGGMAKSCGDSVTLARCLEELGKLFAMNAEREREMQCHKEVSRIKGLLGLHQMMFTLGEGQIIRECEEAANKERQKLILGEAILVVVSSLILGAIACLFIHDFWSRIGTFTSILLAGAGVKIWNAKKRFIKYTHIERS